jgi:hypothetical protein
MKALYVAKPIPIAIFLILAAALVLLCLRPSEAMQLVWTFGPGRHRGIDKTYSWKGIPSESIRAGRNNRHEHVIADSAEGRSLSLRSQPHPDR